jgi:thioredoxin-related protein
MSRWLIPLLGLLWGGIALAQEQSFDPSRDARKDIDAAVAAAGASGRHVLLDVGGEWCSWCKRLDKLFSDQKELRAYRDSNYVTVKVNYSREEPNTAVLSKFPKINGYPHLFVLDGKGKLLRSQETEVLEEGKGHSPAKVMEFLRKWAPKQ